MKNIAIVFLGDFFYDARCINMALTLKNTHNVYIICPYEKLLNHSLFKNITFIQTTPSNGKISRYWHHYKRTLSALNQLNYDTIIAGDLYSLASVVFSNHKKCVVYDCREIYSALAAHKYKPLHRFICTLYEKYFLNYVNKILVTAETDLNYLKKKYHRYTNLDWQIIFNYPANYSPQIKQN